MEDKLLEERVISNLAGLFQSTNKSITRELMTFHAREAGYESAEEMFEVMKGSIRALTTSQKEELLSYQEAGMKEMKGKSMKEIRAVLVKEAGYESEEEIKEILKDNPLFKELCPQCLTSWNL